MTGDTSTPSSPTAVAIALDSSPLSSAFEAHDGTASTESWTTDLELMHHYITVTCNTLPTPRHADRVLRDDIPRLAVTFKYLMHQLLAVTSLHVAYLSPDTSKRYLARASQHQSSAINGMSAALSEVITEETSRALFTTSAFLMVGTFATHRSLGQASRESQCPIDEILETFSVLRGMGAIRKITTQQLQRNLIHDLFGAKPLIPSCKSLRLVEDQLHPLEALITADQSLDKDLKLAVCSGIASLLGFMDDKSTATLMTSRELGVVFGWPRVISDELLGFLRARHPAASTMFLYYCIIIQSLEADYWFLKDWSSRLSRAIATSLRGSPWEEAAQWPLQQLQSSCG